MKPRNCPKGAPLLAIILTASLGLVGPETPGQSFKTLHSFTALNNGTNQDGATPACALLLSGKNLYGTAQAGGRLGNGTVFALRTDGSGFTNLHDFTGADGAAPWTELTLSQGTLYGTAQFGGTGGGGTIFQINTDGTGFTNVYNFPWDDVDGAGRPLGPLVLVSNLVYGSTLMGGIFHNGTLFVLNADGTGFTNLFTFTGGADGGFPSALILSNDALYGTSSGGSSSGGIVFSLQIGAGTLDFIHTFSGGDGAGPKAALALSSDVLYGSTILGGPNGSGTIFAINTDGSGFTTLHNFNPVSYEALDAFTWPHGTNGDGMWLETRLLLSGNTLYGTTYTGGSTGNGTVFAINTDGTGFTNLYTFSAMVGGTNRDGANPRGALAMYGNSLYGTTLQGGAFSNGTVFRISLPVTQPQLDIQVVARSAIVTWPTNAIGFSLQSATNLAQPVAWADVPLPVMVVNGQNVVSNRLDSSPQYFRLSE